MVDRPTRVADQLFELMSARRGHFVLESGHHGELWLDVDQIFHRPHRLRPLVRELAQQLNKFQVDVICGPMTGGALVGLMVAEEMELGFAYASRGSKSNSEELFAVKYRIPDMFAEVVRGRRVAVVNDVINAGSAVRGTLADLQRRGARPAVLASLLTLGAGAANIAAEWDLTQFALAALPNEIWTPDRCPHCAAGTPLLDLVD